MQSSYVVVGPSRCQRQSASMCSVLAFALHSSNTHCAPAQFRISVRKRCGSGESYISVSSARVYTTVFSYNVVSVETYDEIEPWLKMEVGIGVAQDLKAVRSVSGRWLRCSLW